MKEVERLPGNNYQPAAPSHCSLFSGGFFFFLKGWVITCILPGKGLKLYN